MSRSYETNSDVEYAVSNLEEFCEDELQLEEAYEILIRDDDYPEDQDMQTAIFVVQQIFEACEEHEGETSSQIMAAIARRLKHSRASLNGLVKRAFLDTRY